MSSRVVVVCMARASGREDEGRKREKERRMACARCIRCVCVRERRRRRSGRRKDSRWLLVNTLVTFNYGPANLQPSKFTHCVLTCSLARSLRVRRRRRESEWDSRCAEAEGATLYTPVVCASVCQSLRAWITSAIVRSLSLSLARAL